MGLQKPPRLGKQMPKTLRSIAYSSLSALLAVVILLVGSSNPFAEQGPTSYL
jgi:hypothetical protein